MEDNLNFKVNERQPHQRYVEDSIIIFLIYENGRRPQYLVKWKTTSFFGKMEDNLN
jgi:hypothetical protein